MNNAHTIEQFGLFMSQLKATNATLPFFSDFNKISHNVSEIEISLNMLNFLIGKEDLHAAVETLWKRDRHVFDIMDILIATREKDRKMFLDNLGQVHTIHSLFDNVDGIMKFLNETGLAEVLRNRKIRNFPDYVFGVETGLDSNARKNRSGDIMEAMIGKILENAGLEFEQQVSSNTFPDISHALGTDQKVFDFVIKTPSKNYLTEVNFYSIGGSKLNEVARSYTELAPKINAINGFEFVWITDGTGWNSAKNKLQEAFMTIPAIYNLTTIDNFIYRIKH